MTDVSSLRGAQGTRAAASVLRSDPPVQSLRLFVIDDLEPDDDGSSLADMVSALEANRDIHTLGFEFTVDLFVDPADRFGATGTRHRHDHPSVRQLERLFGEVVPLHRSLKVLSFEDCPISSRFMEALLKGLTRHGEQDRVGLERLTFFDMTRPYDLWDDVVPSLVRMLRSNQVKTLQAVDIVGCDLDAHHYHRLFEGLAANVHIKELNVSVDDLRDDAITYLPRLLAHPESKSNARVLDLSYMRFTSAGIRTLARALTTNTNLEELTVFPVDDSSYPYEWFRAFEDVLLRFNYTLRRLQILRDADRTTNDAVAGSVRWRQQQRLDDLLACNVGVRHAHEALCQTGYRTVAPPRTWPLALERIASKPSLLYRFVRRGNVSDWCNVVVSTSAEQSEHHISS
jgi:hypothetical protein